MLKRLGLGLLKGALVGGLVGAGIHFGLGLVTVPALFGYLLVMGAGGTTGIFAGKPPWIEGAWIEAVLKGLAGVGVGALLYWLGDQYAHINIPLPGLTEPTNWTALPVVFAPLISGVYGALVELDNTGDDESPKKGKGKLAKVRVPTGEEETVAVERSSRRNKKKRA